MWPLDLAVLCALEMQPVLAAQGVVAGHRVEVVVQLLALKR